MGSYYDITSRSAFTAARAITSSLWQDISDAELPASTRLFELKHAFSANMF